MSLMFTSDDVPDGWTALTHPEGARYFYHAKRVHKLSQIHISCLTTHSADLHRRVHNGPRNYG